VTDALRTQISKPRRGLALLARNLGLVAAGLVASLLICELLLRFLGISYPVFNQTDPIRGVAHIPGMKSYKGDADGARILLEINSDGWRGPETPLRHPGIFRIALLGDSFIEAFEVSFENTVGEVLERRLAALRSTPVEVLNFGHGGYGTTQELLTLQHEVWKYSPDMILLAVTTGNDIADNYRPLRRADNVPYHVFRNGELVLDNSFLQAKGYRSRAVWTMRFQGVMKHSRLAQLVNRVRHLRRRNQQLQENAAVVPGGEVGLRDEVQVPPTTPEWQEAWRVTEGVLGLMRDECRRKQVPFAIVTLTRGIQVTPFRERRERFLRQLGAKDMYYAEQRLHEFGQREDIPVFSLAPIMAVQAQERHVFFHADHGTLGIGHWNNEGHRVAGELIASWLAKELAHPGRMMIGRDHAPRSPMSPPATKRPYK
jgi:hypothetical protein